ncbi:hypothetical protein ACEK07_03870 [Alcanivoracaceae bacterium MT1]
MILKKTSALLLAAGATAMLASCGSGATTYDSAEALHHAVKDAAPCSATDEPEQDEDAELSITTEELLCGDPAFEEAEDGNVRVLVLTDGDESVLEDADYLDSLIYGEYALVGENWLVAFNRPVPEAEEERWLEGVQAEVGGEIIEGGEAAS